MQRNKPISPSSECQGCQGHVVKLHNDEKLKRGTVWRNGLWDLAISSGVLSFMGYVEALVSWISVPDDK